MCIITSPVFLLLLLLTKSHQMIFKKTNTTKNLYVNIIVGITESNSCGFDSVIPRDDTQYPNITLKRKEYLMTSKERVLACLKGEKVDKIPNLNILMWFASRYAGVNFGDFIQKPEVMVAANIKCIQDFGIDVVTVMSDAYCEAEDFGCRISYPVDGLPICNEYAIKSYDDIKKLKIRKAKEGRRMSIRTEVIRLYKEKLGDTVPIIGWVEGPIAEFSDLYGINNSMIDLILEPDWSEEVMDICTEQAISFAIEQLEAGATIIGIGDAAASIVGPTIYREMILERERKIIKAIQDAGGITKLHICGNITPLLEDIATLQSDILDVDSMVDFKKANEMMTGITCVNGNIDPTDIILNGTPQLIAEEVTKLVAECDDHIMISAGCEIPRDTPHENLKAMDDVLWSLAKR